MANSKNLINSTEHLITSNVLSREAVDFIANTINSKDFEAIALAGDASSRRYMRIINNHPAHKNEALILMIWEPFNDDGKYPFLNVQKHFFKHNVLVPEVVASAPTLGLLLLEDLGDLTLERKFWENQNQNLVLPYYKLALNELIKIHEAATNDRSDCIAFQVEFNVEKLLWEMNYGLEHLIEKFCKIKLSPSTRSELIGAFTKICTTLHEEPKCICHRDYHSRNVMLKLNKTRVIDFQDARMGPIQYDLVSLLHDTYVDLNDSIRNEALDYYISQNKNLKTKSFSRAQFDSIFQLQMIQRCFKACGSFASFYNTREDLRYLKYLKPTLTKVATVLKNYPEYSVFLNIINDHQLCELDFNNPTQLVRK